MCARRRSVAVFGAGVAGLACAHTLAQLGFDVDVYEAEAELGGVARSSRTLDTGQPTEYSWRGFGNWYGNVFHLMKQIPSVFLPGASVYEADLRRLLFLQMGDDAGDRSVYTDQTLVGSLSPADRLAVVREFAAAACAQGDLLHRLRATNCEEYMSSRMSAEGLRVLMCVGGPFVGVDTTRLSLYHFANFFRYALLADCRLHLNKESDELLWKVLLGPSTETWFDPWARWLSSSLGVRFHVRMRLHRLLLRGERRLGGEEGPVRSKEVAAAVVTDEVAQRRIRIERDAYVCAIGPFAAVDMLRRCSPAFLRGDANLALLPRLVAADGEHVQVSFRLAWPRAISLRPGPAVILRDSPFNLTMFSQSDEFHPQVELGSAVATLWTGTACAANVPGSLFGLPLCLCTRAQFRAEVLHQIYACQDLDLFVRQNNGGRSLVSFGPPRLEIWKDWVFPGDTEDDADERDTGAARGMVRSRVPKWVTSTHTQDFVPEAETSFANLFLCGAHVRSSVDLYSMEAAAESGRRAALLVANVRPSSDEREVNFLYTQCEPGWFKALGRIESFFRA